MIFTSPHANLLVHPGNGPAIRFEGGRYETEDKNEVAYLKDYAKRDPEAVQAADEPKPKRQAPKPKAKPEAPAETPAPEAPAETPAPDAPADGDDAPAQE
jgi:hypothetical protein